MLGESAALFAHFDCSASLFGKSAKFRRVLRRTGVAPAQAIAIGDETRDIEAARGAGIACGALRGRPGFGSRFETEVSTMLQVVWGECHAARIPISPR